MISIKRATVDDITLLQTVCIESYTQNFASHWEEDGLQLYLDACFAEEQLKKDLSDPAIHYYLAIGENGVPAGFMKMIENSLLPDTSYTKAIELEKIYVYPAMKGTGIGNHLMNRLFDYAQESGAEIVWLKVIDTNIAARQFYLNKGFELFKRTSLDVPKFKEELRGMWFMVRKL
jgi:ribosomal protein S18 acetylase RimI-like enzyme